MHSRLSQNDRFFRFIALFDSSSVSNRTFGCFVYFERIIGFGVFEKSDLFRVIR
ncbi:hypothetical protein M569_15087 [Genlisea aurea]|uniref:Uncharacterized protein n=1 Tax=Genlisea aurea TaxID=192259 RepID=S8DAJ9_9LAMI|nr:hypothetical protein M569_15087 [Genlisea aurea]